MSNWLHSLISHKRQCPQQKKKKKHLHSVHRFRARQLWQKLWLFWLTVNNRSLLRVRFIIMDLSYNVFKKKLRFEAQSLTCNPHELFNNSNIMLDTTLMTPNLLVSCPGCQIFSGVAFKAWWWDKLTYAAQLKKLLFRDTVTWYCLFLDDLKNIRHHFHS